MNHMIKTLKRKFILLAMVSLTVLLALIVAGMNLLSYEDMLSDVDERLEVLEENSERFFSHPSGAKWQDLFDDPSGQGDQSSRDGSNDFIFGKGGKGGPSMSRDEAEESRFFTVIMSSDCDVEQVNIERIFAVNTSEASEFAKQAVASGKDEGFVEDFRYSVVDDGSSIRVTFLDCSRVLESFRSFRNASIIMSLIGLAAVFAVIVFFAGRIVKPVAESYEKQKRFITDAGHEIKTPLAIIKANLDVIELDPDSTEECLDEIGNQTDRLASLTNDLVYLSRMEEGGNQLVMAEVDLSGLVKDTINSFIPLAAEKGKLINDSIAENISVKGSQKELEKLLSILMENAVKYASVASKALTASSAEAAADADGTEEDFEPALPQIDVSLRRDGRNAVIEVSNAAANELTNESLSHVFERFYRTDSSRNSQTGGHGIGLSMASAIVAAHDGKISAKTTNGYDFIVTASLPA